MPQYRDLKSQAERIRAILETVVDGIVTINNQGIIETVNPATLRIFGYELESELIGQNVKILMPNPYQDAHDRYLQNYRETGVKKIIGFGRDVLGKRKDGSVFPIELAISEMVVEGAQMFTGIVRDASNKKDSEARIQAILDTVIDGIITINDRGLIETVNPAALKIFAYEFADELVGRNVKVLMPQPYQDEHDGYLKNFRETGVKKIIGIGREVKGLRKDGSIFPLELAVSEMQLNGRKMFTGVVRDITERKMIDIAKEEFISTVSHELRTPLTSIRGSIGLLKGGMAGDISDKAKQLLDIAHNNTERLLMLINDILDLSKIESGKMDFNFNRVALDAFLKHAIEVNQGYATQHNTQFVLENNAQGAYLYADEHRLLQVMSNLMSNAAKFAPDQTRVLVSAVRRHHQIRISVTDYGQGIPDKLKPKIFGKFVQGDSSDTRKVGGTGLGLSITKLMVEKHNGYIDFVSERGVGTTFFFDLPELIINSLDTEVKAPSANQERHRILVCEDEPDVASLLKLILAQAGFDADVAYNAKQAETLMAEHDYAAMTLDIMLPDKDGIQFYQELRALKATEVLPVVFVSAKASQTYQKMGDLPNTHWLDKPIDDNQLISLVNLAILGRQTNMKQVLHVEDDQDIRQLIRMLLPDDYVITEAPDLKTAQHLLTVGQFDLVILDIGLPDGSGFALLESIKQLKHKPEVIIFSADDIKVAQAEGVAATLVKSKTTNSELVTKIKQIIE